ncbi:hypothetical protein MKEN_01263400 [Mycena kentingensis (nom. inval.)]|nr:hypothetical protein MKEN_01263400 [Mycena kentingensis (nom. inval.)]
MPSQPAPRVPEVHCQCGAVPNRVSSRLRSPHSCASDLIFPVVHFPSLLLMASLAGHVALSRLSSPMMTDPTLPLELEREIFLLAAMLFPHMRYTLLFVARRVLAWIEPLLYHTLAHDGFNGVTEAHVVARLRTPDFLAKVVRRLSLANGDTNNLGFYPGITHLALGYLGFDSHLIRHFRTLQHLRCLVVHSNLIAPAAYGLDFATLHTLPPFQNLTHLMIFLRFDEMAILCRTLPKLTHLALNLEGLPCKWTHLEDLLSCPQLKLFAVVDRVKARSAGQPTSLEETMSMVPLKVTDPRLVFTHWRKWDEGATGDESFWTVAEKFLEAKARGLYHRNSFFAAM